MLFFYGSSNEKLALEVAQKANIPVGKMEITRFDDSEIKPRILSNVRDQNIIVFQSTSNPVNESLMELFLIVDALKRSSAAKITAVIPYYGYARQNQQHLPGEPVSAHVISKFIETIGIDELTTVEFHEDQITGFFSIPLNHLSALPILANAVVNYLKVKAPLDPSQFAVISPDQGGVERTRLFAQHVGLSQIVVVEKKRNLEQKHVTELVQVSGESVKGKTAIIPDDVIVSGGTVLHAADAILKQGAKRVILAVTHADFIKGSSEKLQNSKVEKVFVTDTIELPDENIFPKLSVISVSSLLADCIKKLE